MNNSTINGGRSVTLLCMRRDRAWTMRVGYTGTSNDAGTGDGRATVRAILASGLA